MALGLRLESRQTIAGTLRLKGRLAWYRGDAAGALALYNEALPVADATGDKGAALGTRLEIARSSIGDQDPSVLLLELRRFAREAEQLTLPNLEVEARLAAAEALGRMEQLQAARQELNRAVTICGRLGAASLTVRVQHSLSMLLRRSGEPLLSEQALLEARRLLEEMRRESGTDDLLKRADLMALAAGP